jgi:anthranilate synthase
MTRERFWPCNQDENLLLGLSEMLRAESLLGDPSWGGSDELLLISGGPQSDSSSTSLLMGPPRIRVIARQPRREFLGPRDDNVSPLKGEIPLSPTPCAMQLEIQEWDGEAWTVSAQHVGTNLAETLRTLNALQPEKNDTNQISIGCWAGGLAYDLVQWTQPWKLFAPPEEGEVLLVLYRVDRWLIHDRNASTLSLISEEDDVWAREVEDLLSILPLPIGISHQTLNELSLNDSENTSHSDKKHAEIVQQVKEAILDGELYQLNFGRRWMGSLSEHPWKTMVRLTKDNPAPMSSWLHAPDLDIALCSCSPELLLATENEKIRTRPIKGTRPRDENPIEDERLRIELLNCTKELAEHMMLVDLERNDIGMVSRTGSVRHNLFQVEGYSQVQHLVSEVNGELKPDEDVWSALQAMFPGGSITGCPKTATIAAIDQLEMHPRSFWTGSIGLVDPRTGYSMWNILIRTLEARMEEGTWKATVQAGGGLVMDSIPEQEVEEAKWKAKALRQAAGWISSGESSVSFSAPHSIYPQSITKRSLSRNTLIGSIHEWKDAENLQDTGLRVLFIDNLDSFSWNIMHALCELQAEVFYCHGRLEKAAMLDEILNTCKPTHIVLGPGPDEPNISPLSMEIARRALNGKCPPLLGICLGHQAIGVAAGLNLSRCPSGAVHGTACEILHDGQGIFRAFSSSLTMARYNSLCLEDGDSQLLITARDEHNNIMAIRHPDLPVVGIQFHPESCASELGVELLSSFLNDSAHISIESENIN